LIGVESAGTGTERVPALESVHAVAWVLESAGRWKPGAVVVVNLSGRGDRNVAAVAALEDRAE